MKNDIDLVSTNTNLQTVRFMLQNSYNRELFVLRNDGSLNGTISLGDLCEFAFDSTIDDLLFAGDVAQPQPIMLCEDDNLEVALKVLSESELGRIAVVKNFDNLAFIGYVTRADVLVAYNKALLESRHEEHGN